MGAAVLHEFGATPVIEDHEDPPGAGRWRGRCGRVTAG